MNSEEFQKMLKKDNVITGDFDFRDESISVMMDRDFIGTKFVNCKIVGGDFASGIFVNCLFENCIISDGAMVGVGFTNCYFVDCKFERMQCDFSIKNCRTDGLSISSLSGKDFWEEEQKKA